MQGTSLRNLIESHGPAGFYHKVVELLNDKQLTPDDFSYYELAEATGAVISYGFPMSFFITLAVSAACAFTAVCARRALSTTVDLGPLTTILPGAARGTDRHARCRQPASVVRGQRASVAPRYPRPPYGRG